MPWSLIYAFWGNFKFNHAKSIHRFMEPALSPCRLLSGSMNSSMAPRACGDRPNLWMCGVPRGRANVWEGWQQMFWTCGHYPLALWTYVWLNPPYLEERSQIRCGILGWFAACSVRAVCWMNSGWIELRTIHQMEFSTEMWLASQVWPLCTQWFLNFWSPWPTILRPEHGLPFSYGILPCLWSVCTCLL